MKYYSFIITLILFSFLNCFSFRVNAQSEITTYKFVSADTTLKISSQYICKRAVSKHSVGTDSQSAWGYGYGFGYVSLHLEFESKTPLSKIYWKHLDVHKYCKYLVEFYDRKDKLLLSMQCFNTNEINIIEAENDKTYGMINLKGIPLSLIYDTKKINITKVLAKKRK